LFKQRLIGQQGRKYAFGLPGNPVSSAVTFQLFVLPALKRLKGLDASLCVRTTIPCKLATALAMDPERPEYHRYVSRVHVAKGGDVILSCDGRHSATIYRDGTEIVASSTGSQRSSRLMSMYGANAFVCVPQGSGTLRQGNPVAAPHSAPICARINGLFCGFVPPGSTGEAILIGDVLAQKPAWVTTFSSAAKPEVDCCDHRHHHRGHGDVKTEAKGNVVEGGYDAAGFRVCVLTVSDRVSRGEAEDRSGPTACKTVAAIPGVHQALIDWCSQLFLTQVSVCVLQDCGCHAPWNFPSSPTMWKPFKPNCWNGVMAPTLLT
jgi:MoeA C-terminal region (domain IV)